MKRNSIVYLAIPVFIVVFLLMIAMQVEGCRAGLPIAGEDTVAQDADQTRPFLPAGAQEAFPNYWYCYPDGRAEEYALQHKKATIIQQHDYADNGWFFRHTILEASDEERLVVYEVRDQPMIYTAETVGDEVRLNWANNNHIFVTRVSRFTEL